jgi:fucose permease
VDDIGGGDKGKIVGGGAGGAILTVIAGLVKSMVASQQTR